jgi:cholesterol oxidase
MTDGDRQYDAVVIGSGFGGSITALRLAEAGRSVLVLERGRRYAPQDFPRDVRRTDALLWRHDRRRAATGLYDVRFFSGLAVVVAAGVGGGSLIYANIHIRPDPAVFEDPRWPGSVTRQALDPYYDKVAAGIGLAPVPAGVHLAKRDAFRKAAAQAGHAVFDPDEAVTWPDPAATGADGTCGFVAECEFGCPRGAKRSMDRTYLARAERLGAQVRTGILARHVSPARGGYAVSCQSVATGEPVTVTGRRVIVAAGTLGTNEIMLRSRDQAGTLPEVSGALGRGFSANGDFLGSVQNSAIDLDPSYGPDVTSVIRFFDAAPGFTMAAPTFSAPVMRVLAALGQPSGRWLRPVSGLLWRGLPYLLPLAFASGLLSRPAVLPGPHHGDPRRMTNLFCIGRDNGGGRVRLGPRGLDITWAYARENAALVSRMEAAMAQVAAAYGGTYATLSTWNVFRRVISVHALGGCHLSDTPATGVVSLHGEVHGYPGLFIADGSVVPASLGFHPVMTIAALAERTAEAVAASFP